MSDRRRSTRHRFLSSEELEKAEDDIARIVRRDGLKVAIIGGYALQIYGSDRNTIDIDIVSYEDISGLPFIKPLAIGGYQSKTSEGTPVDVVIRNDDYTPLYDDAISAALRLENVKLPVVSPEFLAAMKMSAHRDRDKLDLQWLISSGELDFEKARKVIKKYLGLYGVQDFNSYVEEAEWRAERDRRG